MIGADEHPNIRHPAKGGPYPPPVDGIGGTLAAADGGDDPVFLCGLFVVGPGRGCAAGVERPVGSGTGVAGSGGGCAKNHPGSAGRAGGEGSGGLSGRRKERGAAEGRAGGAFTQLAGVEKRRAFFVRGPSEGRSYRLAPGGGGGGPGAKSGGGDRISSGGDPVSEVAGSGARL